MKKLSDALKLVLPTSMRAGERKRTYCKWIASEIIRISAAGNQPVTQDEADTKAALYFTDASREGVSTDHMANFWSWYSAKVKTAKQANAAKGWKPTERKARAKARDKRESIKFAKALPNRFSSIESNAIEAELSKLTGKRRTLAD